MDEAANQDDPAFQLPAGIGRLLSRVRSEAGVTQKQLSTELAVDQSWISRAENGDLDPAPGDVLRLLKALKAHRLAKELLKYLQQRWCHLARPDFAHPQREVLWKAEETLETLAHLIKSDDVPVILRAHLEMHHQSLLQAAQYLLRLDHAIAFIGDVGIGKSTALCFLSELVSPRATGAKHERVLLEIGQGGTTSCEVRITQGLRFGLRIEPHSDQEVYRFVRDWCAEYNEAPKPSAGGAEKGVSTEVARLLRNMTGLKRPPVAKRGSDETRAQGGKASSKKKEREAAPLPETLESVARDFKGEALEHELSQRLRLWQRTRRELWWDGGSGDEGIEWLRKTFRDVNNGLVPDVSLPVRIEVVIPREVLGGSPYGITLIDTKGIDKSIVVRGDLKTLLDDSRALLVLCCRFNDAPSVSLQSFIEHALETGDDRSIATRAVMLVLPQSDEARREKNDDREPVRDDEEGYEVKRIDAQDKLRQAGAASMPILFFNAASDDAVTGRGALVERIGAFRLAYADRIHELARTVTEIRDNQEERAAEAAREDVLKRLNVFRTQRAKLGSGARRNAWERLVERVVGTHAQTIWATVRRSGTWSNFDVYFHLGDGAAADARHRCQKIFDELDGLLLNMLGEEELGTAHGFLRDLEANLQQWQASFFQAVRLAGEETFRLLLQQDSALWSTCEGYYGTGGGFRNDVAGELRQWFEDEGRQALCDALEDRIHRAWKKEFLEPLRRVCAPGTHEHA